MGGPRAAGPAPPRGGLRRAHRRTRRRAPSSPSIVTASSWRRVRSLVSASLDVPPEATPDAAAAFAAVARLQPGARFFDRPRHPPLAALLSSPERAERGGALLAERRTVRLKALSTRARAFLHALLLGTVPTGACRLRAGRSVDRPLAGSTPRPHICGSGVIQCSASGPRPSGGLGIGRLARAVAPRRRAPSTPCCGGSLGTVRPRGRPAGRPWWLTTTGLAAPWLAERWLTRLGPGSAAPAQPPPGRTRSRPRQPALRRRGGAMPLQAGGHALDRPGAGGFRVRARLLPQ